MTKAIKKLLAARPDTPVQRDGYGRVRGISVAAYDAFRALNAPARMFAGAAMSSLPASTVAHVVHCELRRFVESAEDVALSVARTGAPGARAALERLALDVGAGIVRQLEALSAAPAGDPPSGEGGDDVP